MPLEVQEDGLEKNPDLQLAQWKHLLLQTELSEQHDRVKILDQLHTVIKKENMAPFYEELIKEFKKDANNSVAASLPGLPDDVVATMKERNLEKIQEFDAYIEDAEKNLTEMEVRENNLQKAEYLCRIGNRDDTIVAFRKTYEKTVSLGQRLDIVFNQIRIGLFYMDHDIITRNIDKAKILIEEGGDWDRRNRLKVYQGMYAMAIRDFKSAADLYLETISTFTSYELMDYIDFVKYTVIVSMVSLPRNELKEKVIEGAEIQEVLHSQPKLKTYMMSLYECKYSDFFKRLADVETELKEDRLLNPHYRYYVREMRIKAYSQLLESYSSLTLDYMANSFGVTKDFIDRELHRFIAAGRLHCKIDKVSGIVETTRPDNKNWQYQSTIKQGDILLNRIQKLSRVINI